MGIEIAWTYNLDMSRRKLNLTMDDDIKAVLIKYGHINPTKPHILHQKDCKIQYGAKS